MIRSLPSYDIGEAITSLVVAHMPGGRVEHIKETMPFGAWKVVFSVPGDDGAPVVGDWYLFRDRLDRWVEQNPQEKPGANPFARALDALGLTDGQAARLLELPYQEVRDLRERLPKTVLNGQAVESLLAHVNARLARLMSARDHLVTFKAARTREDAP